MKILKESKTQLPITYLTNFVSRSWGEVGNLKEELEAIKHEFKDIKKIEESVNGLIDAYLICIGTLESILNNKKYVEFPEETEALKESVEEIKPDLEAIDIIKDKVALENEEDKIKLVLKDQIDEKDADKLVLDVSEEEQDILEAEFNEEEAESEQDFEESHKKSKSLEENFEPFEYFCDFE